MNKQINITLAGNPNCGKTTLFNALTGSRQYVGNWPGVTVEKKEGKLKDKNYDIVILDLPGIYSLSANSIDEMIARNYIVENTPDVVVNIVDASNIERNLYLTTQLIELGRPVVIALNMMDIAEKRGYSIDNAKLSNLLGVPVVPIIASKKQGMEELIATVIRVTKKEILCEAKFVSYGDEIEKRIEGLVTSFQGNPLLSKYHPKWLAIKVLEEDAIVMNLLNMQSEIAVASEVAIEEDMESFIADQRYRYISVIISKSIDKPKGNEITISDKVDKVLTNRWLGLPIFALIMYFVFYFTFDLVGNKLLDMIDVFFAETLTSWVSTLLETVGVESWLHSLIVDGIIGGVGGVVVFLPNIACLFFAISILEDSGYMARVAFIMDRAMRRIGLSGKAFIPMVLGFGCNAPAIMSSRTLENEKDRLTSILINPFMSCAARLPVYTLFASVFFSGHEKSVVFSLYVLGIFVAIAIGLIFKNTLFKGDATPFIMELPPYRIPTIKGLVIHVWDRIKGFLIKAGTLIFGASMILWFILGFNLFGPAELTESIGAHIGAVFAPIFKPLGFGNWQASLSLITGILAKEVVVSNMSIIYGLGEEATSQTFSVALAGTFTQLSAYTFMVFVLLYTPCIATIAVIKRETNSWKWTIFSVGYQFAVSWLVAMLVYRVGSLIGY